jgi:hypothetical protein
MRRHTTHNSRRHASNFPTRMRPKHTLLLPPLSPSCFSPLSQHQRHHEHTHTYNRTDKPSRVSVTPKPSDLIAPAAFPGFFGYTTNITVPLESSLMIPFIQPETWLLCYAWSSPIGQLPIFPTFNVSDLDYILGAWTSYSIPLTPLSFLSLL